MKYYLIVFLGVLGISCSAIFGRITTCSGMVTAMYRMSFTALLLLPVVLLRHREELNRADRRSILMCILSGVFLGFHFYTYLTSLKYTSIASCVVLVDTEVLFVALFLFLLYRERLGKAALAGIGIALAGSIVIALGDRSGGGANVILGDILALLGALCSSVYTMIGRTQRRSLSTTVYTFLVYSAASASLILMSFFTQQQFFGHPVTDYLSCLAMSVFCTLMGHSVFSYSLKYVDAAFVSTSKLLEPVFSTLLGVFLLAEMPRQNQIIGGIIVIAGILIYLNHSRKEA